MTFLCKLKRMNNRTEFAKRDIIIDTRKIFGNKPDSSINAKLYPV